MSPPDGAPGPGGAARVAGIIGWPVAHSLSPAMHNAAFAAEGLDWVYAAFAVPPDRLSGALEGARALGLAGLNVTMPHKQSVLGHLDEIDAIAERAGAVNTIVRRGERLFGTNTDGPGFIRFLEDDAGVRPGDASALVLGAGGAARGVAASLTAAGASVAITARRADAAAELAASCGGTQVAWEPDAVAAAASAATLVVNATPVADASLPLDAARLTPRHTVVDLVYAPPQTDLLIRARAQGAGAHNGLGMLLHQAALSFELWTGRPAPLEAMSAALLRAARARAAHGEDAH